METRRRKRAREEGEAEAAEEPPAAAPGGGGGGSSSSSSSSLSSTSSSSPFSSSSSSSAAAEGAPAPFRGPAADSVLGERLIDVIGIVAAMGFAAEVSHCLYLCGETWRKGDKGATNDMLTRSLERQCGASAARAAKREDSVDPEDGGTMCGTTQLMRAAMLNNLPRVLQLVQLGAPLELEDEGGGFSALHLACFLGREHVVRALLDGKYEGRGAKVDVRNKDATTPLMMASFSGHEGIVRLLLARGAIIKLQNTQQGWSALHAAVVRDHPGTVALLCAAPGAAAALALCYSGQTPLGWAIARGHAACEAVLRAHGATS
jgi:hypothetical protein